MYLTRENATEIAVTPVRAKAVQFRTKKEALSFREERLHSASQKLFEVQDASTGEKHAGKKRSRHKVLPSTDT
jgi:hypothetical protein